MSSRPITNLERIMASVNIKEDEVVLTPEPLMGKFPVFNFNQIPAPNHDDPVDMEPKREKEAEEFFTASPGSTDSESSEDVPLTVELMTNGVQLQTSAGPRKLWGFNHERRKKLTTKRHRSLKAAARKNGIPSNLPTSSMTVLEYDSTSDGLDDNQVRERNKKRKTKKRQNGSEEKPRKKQTEERN